MGLSIHYSGTIRSTTQIPQLVAEVQDVCAIFGWPYHVADDENINGISFTPPECETLCLTFSPNGELVSRLLLLYNIHPATTISVKTQYAGIAVHKAIIKLLWHLSKTYLAHFELQDEGGYWESGDEAVLQKQFELYNTLLKEVKTALTDFKSSPEDTPQTLAERLEAFLNTRWNEPNGQL